MIYGMMDVVECFIRGQDQLLLLVEYVYNEI